MSFLEDLEEAIRGIKTSRIVSCPTQFMEIPGIDGDAHAQHECVGLVAELSVPKSGEIISATLFDPSYQKIQLDLEIFKQPITEIADNAAWAPSDIDMVNFVTELVFSSYDDHINSLTWEILNIGKAYTAPLGKFWIKAVTRGAPTYAAGAKPRFQIQILSLDPAFVEV